MTARRIARRLPAAAALLGALALAGCISVLPKEKPVQMYRFGADAPPAAVAPGAVSAGSGSKIGLVLARVDLPRAAAGDRLLTVTGRQAAYVGGARWVSPAAVLFEDAVERAFDARSTAVRIVNRGETGASQGALRVEATDFETRYATPGAAPTVRVTLQALLLRRNGGFVADHTVSVEAPAAENAVHAIVAAYDAAVGKADAELIAWTDANAALVLTPDPTAAARPAQVVTTTATTTSQ